MMRRSICEPIPAIFRAAELLLEAGERHRLGDRPGAVACLDAANDRAVWLYTDQAWGKGAAARHGFVAIPGAPPYLPAADRPRPRMPDAKTQREVLSRDGHHCRFCGIPVVDPALRRLFGRVYPEGVTWGATNAAQHAAFQCMWLQFDHVLPNSRGGDSSAENVVVACAPCNFGRMEATLEEARLIHPLKIDVRMIWKRHAEWDGLERFRVDLNAT